MFASATPSSDRGASTVIGLYEMTGAILGIVAWTAIALFRPEAMPWRTYTINCIPFTVLGAAGHRLWRRLPRGLLLTSVVQIAQVPVLVSPALSWKFCAGPYLTVVLDIQSQSVRGGAGVDLSQYIGRLAGQLRPQLGINLVPLVLLAVLFANERRCGALLRSGRTASAVRLGPPLA